MILSREIIENFNIPGEILTSEKYGNGHINDTYLVVARNSNENTRYILQRINNKIFPNVAMLMRNQELVTKHIAQKLFQEPNFDKRLLLNIVYTKSGDCFLEKDEQFYRCYEFIEGGECLEIITKPEEFYLSGLAFGRFQRLLDGFNAENLYDVIENFHNTIERFKQLEDAIALNLAGRKNECESITNEFLKRKSYANIIVDALASGDIPSRVTHNDTKLNNVLIDLEKGIPLAVIDLDTVMSGSIVYDFGDSIRYGANKGAEDEQDLEKVGFDMELFKAFAKGFVNESKSILTKNEIKNLAFGAILMTYECGMRFLADHLNGDKYFKVHRQNHNLDRAKTQLKMVQDMEKERSEMEAFIGSLCD